LEYEILENVNSGIWLSECFFYTTISNKLNYCLSGKSMPMVNLDKKLWILGFIPQQSRIYLMDSERAIVSFAVTLSFIEYQISVV